MIFDLRLFRLTDNIRFIFEDVGAVMLEFLDRLINIVFRRVSSSDSRLKVSVTETVLKLRTSLSIFIAFFQARIPSLREFLDA